MTPIHDGEQQRSLEHTGGRHGFSGIVLMERTPVIGLTLVVVSVCNFGLLRKLQ
jgi:hypothetical protein